jgi:hypothetical protein
MGQWLVPRHDEDPKDVTLGMLRDAAREFDPEAVRWEQTDGGVFGVLPGADSSFGEFDVRIAPPRDGAPAGIEFVVRDSGAIFMRTTLDDWRDVGAERWPHAIEADVFDPASNQPVGVMTLTITSLTREDPGDVFTLDRHAFERVWSDDAATFVKGGAAICEKPAALVSDLVRRWRAAPEDVDFLATLAGIDHQTAPDEAFQLFQLSEREYAEKVTGMSRAEREKFDTELFHEEVRDKRRVIRTVIDSAIERANAGEADLAEQALAALDRIADVSSRPEQLAIGRLVAEKLKQQIAEARAKVEKPEPAWEAHPTAEPSAAANAYEHVRDIYARWTESTKPMDLVEAFSELEKRAEGEASFRLYSLTEAEHLALSESERTENLRRYMVEGATYRAIFRQAVDEATERIRAGDDEAESALVAMERVVEASKEQGQLEFGRLLARLFESWVDEARKQIDDR